ncbi:SGNH/GDSL hydrolase family protein [Stappia albiluteola]
MLALMLSLPVTLTVMPEPAYAQQGQRESSGFNPLRPLFRLFGIDGGSRKRERPQQEEPAKRKQQARREPAKPVVVEDPKDEDARTVLVVGDFLADGLNDGLVAAYAKTPSIKVDKLIFANNGLSDQPEPDYPTRVTQALQGRDISVVVIFTGAGDARDLVEGGATLEFKTPAWEEAYKRRIDKLAKAVRFQKRPLIWVSLPPTKGPQNRVNLVYLNELTKARVEAADGIFVDIWDVFMGEDGKYTSYGPDVEGTRRQLRPKSGVGFTWPGNRKVAFFCEREIARVIGPSGAFAFDGVEDDPNFIVLTGRTTSPETELAGGEEGLPPPVADTVQHRLIVKGEALAPVIGRIDDYRLR